MNGQQRPVDIRDLLSHGVDDAAMPDVAAQAWQQAGRIRTRRRTGVAGVTACAALGLGVLFGPDFLGLDDEGPPTVADPSETLGTDELAGVPSDTVTFVFVPEGDDASTGSETVDESAASPAEAADLVGTEWTLQSTIGGGTAPGDVTDLGGETTLGFSEEGWGVSIADCGEAGVQGLEVNDGVFPPAEVASTDIGCESDVQAAEDFWMAALPQGGWLRTVDDEALLLSVRPVDPDESDGESTDEESDEPTDGTAVPPEDEVTVAFARSDTAGEPGDGPVPATPEDVQGSWGLLPESVEPEGPVEDLVALPEAGLQLEGQEAGNLQLSLGVGECAMGSSDAQFDEDGTLTLADFRGPHRPCEGEEATAINHWVTLWAGQPTLEVDGDRLLVTGTTAYELAEGLEDEPPRSDGQTPTPLTTGVQAVLPEDWVVEPMTVSGEAEVPTGACLRDPADAEELVCNASLSAGHTEQPEQTGVGEECETEDVQVGDYEATRTRYAQGSCEAEDPGTTDFWWVPDLGLSIRATAGQDVDGLLASIESGGDTTGHVARLVDTDGSTVQVELLEYFDADPSNPDPVVGEAEFTVTEDTRCFARRISDPMITDPVSCDEAMTWLYGFRGVVTVLVDDAGEVIALSQPWTP